jgi:hypothetical protein
MQSETHPLEPFFHQAVRNSYEGKLGLRDLNVTTYIARILCEFSDAENLYPLRDEQGNPVADLGRMLEAADPVFGTAPSFDAERRMRKHIGDFSLFVAGMYPEAIEAPRSRRRSHTSMDQLIHAGKESYYIVSQFNLFEYEEEAPLFLRLADNFERCILGLNMVREDLGMQQKQLPPPRVN